MKKCAMFVPMLIAIVLVVVAPLAGAQCDITYFTSDINSSQGTSSSYGIGQSFTACQSGYVAWITILSSSNSGTPSVLVTQAGTDINVRGNPQDVVLQTGGNRIELEIPLGVTDGMTYSFGIFPTGPTSSLSLNPEDPYPGGELISWSPNTGLSTLPDKDLLFGVEILPYNPVPTQRSAWGAVKGLYR